MLSVKLDLNDELLEKIERDTLDNGTSRQKVIQHAVEIYYSSEAHNIDLLKKELEHRDELDKVRKEEYDKLLSNFEWLRGQYDLVTIKLLPAAQPWWKRWFRRTKRE